MTDTEILNWIEKRIYQIETDTNGTIIVHWFNKHADDKQSAGKDLRHAVTRAAKECDRSK